MMFFLSYLKIVQITTVKAFVMTSIIYSQTILSNWVLPVALRKLFQCSRRMTLRLG